MKKQQTSRGLCKTPPFAKFRCQAQISILKILNVFLRLKFSPSLNLNKIERFSKVSSCGFTLIEILVAIFIFAVVITTIFGSYNTVFSNVEKINASITDYEMAKNCLCRMIIDLKSIHVSLPPEYSPPGFDDPPDNYRIVGDTSYSGNNSFSRLRFTSLAHLSFGNKINEGIAEIIYYVQATDDRHYALKRADSLYPYKPFEEKGNDPVLCEDLISMSLKYYDHEGTECEIWNSESETFGYASPRAIGIKLEVGDDSVSQIFETMVALPVYREKIE